MSALPVNSKLSAALVAALAVCASLPVRAQQGAQAQLAVAEGALAEGRARWDWDGT